MLTTLPRKHFLVVVGFDRRELLSGDRKDRERKDQYQPTPKTG